MGQQMQVTQQSKQFRFALGSARKGAIKSVWMYVITFQWVRVLLAWSLTSAGTISEAVFVLAPLWICIKASVPDFVKLFIPNADQVKAITDFANTLLVGVPELIMIAAIITVLSKLSTWKYRGKLWDITGVWTLAFGIPTAIFIIITVLTLWASFGNDTFRLDTWVVQVRGIAAYWYGISSLLYTKIGKPQEVSRLQEKDTVITELTQKGKESQQKIDELLATIEGLKQNIDGLNQSIERQKKETLAAKSEVLQVSESALQAYSEQCVSWVFSGVKTADVDEIARYTGHNKQKIRWAIKSGDIKRAPGKAERYILASVAEWLKKTPPPQGQDEDLQDGYTPMLKIVP